MPKHFDDAMKSCLLERLALATWKHYAACIKHFDPLVRKGNEQRCAEVPGRNGAG